MIHFILFKSCLGRCGRNVDRGHNDRHIRLYCIRLLCFLCENTEFHDMQKECQRILIHFLLLISHKYAACAKKAALFAISP